MNSCRKVVVVVLWVVVVMLGLRSSGGASRSRSINAFRVKPRDEQQMNSTSNGAASHFLNFMPKRWIPASAPSRKHNDLGLQTSRFP